MTSSARPASGCSASSTARPASATASPSDSSTKAVKEGLNKRFVNENSVLNLAYSHPDLLTGFNPVTGGPELYGSIGVDIDCAVIGYTTKQPPTTPGPPSLPGSQFPPR